MRKILLTTALVMVPSLAFAQSIIGSKHDLSDATSDTNEVYATSTDGRVCVFCHVPHNANPAVNGLWNRANPAVGYTWGSTVRTIGGTTLPNAADAQSVRCFTCHDGVADIGALYNTIDYTLAGTDQAAGVLTNSFYIVQGTTMAGNHPVSVSYPNPVNAGPYNGTTTGAQVDTTQYKAAPADAFIYTDASGDRGIECGSCHDPHDTTYSYFLRDTLDVSALCLDCHTK